MIPNTNYKNLKDSYLFYHIAQKTKAYLEQHPGAYLYRMGIGDVSLPLCDAVIQALHKAVDDQAVKASFHGYMPECGDPELRQDPLPDTIKRGTADLSRRRYLFPAAPAMSWEISSICSAGTRRL